MRTNAQRAYNNRAQLRSRLKRKYGAVTKQEVNELERRYNMPKQYHVVFNKGAADNQQSRRRFLLYRACIKIEVKRLRSVKKYPAAANLEQYFYTLQDTAPRETKFYLDEWKLISRALRPQGSRPTTSGGRRAYSCYLWICRWKQLIEGGIL